MADPIHGNRAQKQAFVRDAFKAATTVPSKIYMHPVYKYQMSEWEYSDYQDEVRAKASEHSADTKNDESKSGNREDSQYTLALKTAFELGMKAGMMQRPNPPPCGACERRKERNRIAAQTSRIEKRRLESQGQTQPVARRIRLPTAGTVPASPSPYSSTAYAHAPSFADTTPPAAMPSAKVEESDSESDISDDDHEPPPF